MAEKNIYFGGEQWKGKLWYAYGTSITSDSYGRYVKHIVDLSGMEVRNFGRPGDGLGDFGYGPTGKVYRDLTSLYDGKEYADLITIEVGANDITPTAPIGEEHDFTEDTLCGRLNMALEYLQRLTRAQIVIIASPIGKWRVDEFQEYSDALNKFRKVAFNNRVYWIDGNSCLGYGRIDGNSDFVHDAIHQTYIGGFNYALSIWKELKDIPPFVNDLP